MHYCHIFYCCEGKMFYTSPQVTIRHLHENVLHVCTKFCFRHAHIGSTCVVYAVSTSSLLKRFLISFGATIDLILHGVRWKLCTSMNIDTHHAHDNTTAFKHLERLKSWLFLSPGDTSFLSSSSSTPSSSFSSSCFRFSFCPSPNNPRVSLLKLMHQVRHFPFPAQSTHIRMHSTTITALS